MNFISTFSYFIIITFLALLSNVTLKHRYDVPSYLKFLRHAETLVQPSHAVICELTKWLAPVFCRARGAELSSFPAEHLQLKRRLCEDQIAVMDRVAPGSTRARGEKTNEHVCGV